MKIELKNIKVKDLVSKYSDNGEDGVFGYNGFLEIRPIYQREFIYKEDKRNKVIDTIIKGFPLNIMYWVDNGNNHYEVLDGQQRTISICEYIKGNFSIKDKDGNPKYFHSLTNEEKNKIENYEIFVYFCSGTDSEKLEWFKTINIAGESLTNQELRNAIYTGNWLTDAKKHFSRNNCVAYQKASKYLSGSSIRQDYLETVLKWISKKELGKENVELYMANHQNDKDANELWQYFESVMDWTNRVFKTYRSNMKGLDWGLYYNNYNMKKLNSNEIELKINELMEDDEVTNKKGIYQYILSDDIKHLNIRTFTEKDKIVAFNKQLFKGTGKAICPRCNDSTKLFDLTEMEADHIVPWSKGGKTNLDNCQMLCKYHNGIKSNH
jgi:hypothetical protein